MSLARTGLANGFLLFSYRHFRQRERRATTMMMKTLAALFLLAACGGVSATQQPFAFSETTKSTKLDDHHKRPQLRASEARRQLYSTLLAKSKVVDAAGNAARALNNNNNNYGFDITKYSLKYTGCAGVDTYSDEMAEQEEIDSVLKRQRFVLLRLCATESCNKYSVNGCSSDYAELLLDMYDYLEAMGKYNEEKQQRYCEFCERCYENDGSSSWTQNQNNNGGRKLDETDASATEVSNANGYMEKPEWDADAACEDLCGDYYYDYSGCEIRQEEDGTQSQSNQNQQQQEEERFNLWELMGECARVDRQDDSSWYNGQQWDGSQWVEVEYFVGPTCDSDGYSIVLSTFGDEFCSTNQDEISFSELTGYEVTEQEMRDYYPQECVPCLEVEVS
jgi:hypothetical protein